jgi:hypothetical protein
MSSVPLSCPKPSVVLDKRAPATLKHMLTKFKKLQEGRKNLEQHLLHVSCMSNNKMYYPTMHKLCTCIIIKM